MRKTAPVGHHQRFRQTLDFSGMLYARNIRPTDIDSSLDFGGELFVFIEAKHVNKEIDVGQKRHLENLCKSMRDDRIAYAVVCSHETESCDDVLLKDSIVRSTYSKNKIGVFDWYEWKNDITVENAVARILKKHDMESYIVNDASLATVEDPNRPFETTSWDIPHHRSATSFSVDGIASNEWNAVMAYPIEWISDGKEVREFQKKKGVATDGRRLD